MGEKNHNICLSSQDIVFTEHRFARCIGNPRLESSALETNVHLKVLPGGFYTQTTSSPFLSGMPTPLSLFSEGQVL